MKVRDIIISIETLLILLLAVLWLYRPYRVIPSEHVQVFRDTIHDTTNYIMPVPVHKDFVRTVRVPIADTIHIRDTTYIELPIESKVYKDSTYEAHISGYKPSLDSIRVFTHTVIETRQIAPKKASRWGLGVTAGYGATPKGLLPFIGAGIIYKIQ